MSEAEFPEANAPGADVSPPVDSDRSSSSSEVNEEHVGSAAPDATADPGPRSGADTLGDPDGLDVDLVAEAEAAVAADIASVASQRDEYRDALRRLQADFENYKKRTLKQQTDHLERAAQDLVQKLLPVLDAADLAIAHGGGEAVVQIGQLLLDTLIKEGLDGIAPEPGEPFDPTQHEAVVHEPGDGEPVVVELLRAGYRWKGRLLRAAMVKVKG